MFRNNQMKFLEKLLCLYVILSAPLYGENVKITDKGDFIEIKTLNENKKVEDTKLPIEAFLPSSILKEEIKLSPEQTKQDKKNTQEMVEVQSINKEKSQNFAPSPKAALQPVVHKLVVINSTQSQSNFLSSLFRLTSKYKVPKQEKTIGKPYLQSLLNTYFKISLPDAIFHSGDFKSMVNYLKENHPQTASSKNSLNYGLIKFTKESKGVLWIHYINEFSKGCFMMVNEDMEVIYWSKNAGYFVHSKSINFFNSNSTYFLLTQENKPAQNTSEYEKSTTFFKADKNGLIEASLNYTPEGHISLVNTFDKSIPEGLSDAGKERWSKGILTCKSSLEFSTFQPFHSILRTNAAVNMDLSGLTQSDINIIETSLRNKYYLSPNTPLDTQEKWYWSEEKNQFISIDYPKEKTPCPSSQLFSNPSS